ncbi:MAG TPA: guanylate kinase [Stellaceae bacterium]|jgi:guanylate kinase|nr:guanylate kinase [Stellaceae bacterium]
MAEPSIKRRGLLLVLSSPSGAGKTTISRKLFEDDGKLAMSVSVTTRAKRPGEVDGTHYYFVDRPKFDAMVAQGELLEHAIVFGNCYGTPRGPVMKVLEAGRDIISDVDWQGTQQLKQNVPDDVVAIFILPPSVEALKERLQMRAQDSEEVVQARMAKSSDEMSHWPEYDYVIVNDNLQESVRQVQAILDAERKRRTRQVGLYDFVNSLRGQT